MRPHPTSQLVGLHYPNIAARAHGLAGFLKRFTMCLVHRMRPGAVSTSERPPEPVGDSQVEGSLLTVVSASSQGTWFSSLDRDFELVTSPTWLLSISIF